MPAERKKHLAKEISTPDARGLKGCRKRLLQPNQPKEACRNLFFAVEESLFSNFSVYCLLRLQIVQGGNLAFAIAGEHCRANIGGECDS